MFFFFLRFTLKVILHLTYMFIVSNNKSYYSISNSHFVNHRMSTNPCYLHCFDVAVCGKTMLGASDTFSHSPKGNRPELCRWRISATHGEKIVLNISRLDMPKSYNCERDYLEVRDGNYIKSPLLGMCSGFQSMQGYRFRLP